MMEGGTIRARRERKGRETMDWRDDGEITRRDKGGESLRGVVRPWYQVREQRGVRDGDAREGRTTER